jgi:5,10-methylenetetrahydromethanopterin reductase
VSHVDDSATNTSTDQVAVVLPQTAVWVFPANSAEALVDAVVQAEDLGIDQWWVGDEGAARDPFSVLSAAAVRTNRILLGVGITNPYTRHPGVTAVSAQTIHELSHGRFMLGFGAGGSLALDPFEMTNPAPLRQVERAIRIARAVGAGKSTEGYRWTDGAVQDQPGVVPMPIYIGAKGERLNRLASTDADGAILAGIPPYQLAEVIGWVRSIRDVAVSIVPSVAFTEEAMEQLRPHMVWGLMNAPTSTHERLGIAAVELSLAADALRRGDDGPARLLVTDAIVAANLLFGTPPEIGVQLADLAAAYLPTSIGLALIPGALQEDQQRAAEAFAAMRLRLATLEGPGTRS